MKQTLKELSTARTMQQLCEYGDKRIAELTLLLVAAKCFIEDDSKSQRRRSAVMSGIVAALGETK